MVKSSVIIATNWRSTYLERCLDSLLKQSLLPSEVIVAHGGGDLETKPVSEHQKYDRLQIKYFNFGNLGAARQRNLGANESSGDILFFLDDDVICEPSFIRNILLIFEEDGGKRIGGVCGTINGCGYTPLSRVNKFLFDFCLHPSERSENYAGRVVGPAINFWPMDDSCESRDVDWMASTACAYRRNAFFKHMFNSNFYGYSFMEDVELSCLVAKDYRLVSTSRSRVDHKDLGKHTHKNWVEIGKMQVLNRWCVMTEVMNRRSPMNLIRFVYYQLYSILSESKSLFLWPEAKHTVMRWLGRMLGMLTLLLRLLRIQRSRGKRNG